jgi:NADPH2:quinone reductase
MNAAIVHSFDAPPRFGAFKEPIAEGKEQIVHVTAAGLHRIVKALANGSHYGSTTKPPFIPGLDGVGRLADGSRVYFGGVRSPYGPFAERAAASVTFPLPDGIDDATAAGIANPGMSSWAALKLRARIAAGESVLVLGATGVSGRLAVQIAKRLGAKRVVAAGRNIHRLKELDADAVIPLHQEHDALVAAFRQEPCDIVVDYLWGTPAEALIEAISKKGLQHASGRVRYLQVGSTAGATITLPADALRSSGLEILGSGFGSVSMTLIFQLIVEFLAEAAARPFHFQVKAVPLCDVESAWSSDERVVFQP